MNNQQIQNTLSSLGFNDKEIQIYLAGLSIGTNSASQLGGKTSISRSTAQYTCNSLVEKGVFSVIERGNVKYYSPENPEKLLGLINKEYEKVERKMISTRQILGDLKDIMNPLMGSAKVKFYSGIDEVIDLVDDALSEKEMIYGVIELVDSMPEKFTRYLNDQYIPKRKKSKVPAKAIFNDTSRTKKYQMIDQEMNRVSMLVPAEKYPFEGCMQIYGNKVVFYSYNSNDMTGIMIENVYIKTIMFSLFKLAWEQAKHYNINEKYKDEEL